MIHSKNTFFFLTFLFASFFSLAVKAQYQFHLVYLDGELLDIGEKKYVNVGDSLLADSKVKLNGKLAVFFDTSGSIMRSLRIENNQSNEILVKGLSGIRGQTPKCCFSSFTYFKMNLEKPFPIINKATLLSFTADDAKKFFTPQIGLGFESEVNGQMDFKAFPMDDTGKKILLYKAIQYIFQNKQDSLIKDFTIYPYKKAKEPVKFNKPLITRDLILVNPTNLKEKLNPSVQFFKNRFSNLDKENKELILDCMSRLIYELYGFPDEENLMLWLMNNFQLDLRY